MRKHGLRAELRQQLVDDVLGLSINLDTYEPDELLSMGQGELVASVGVSDKSIYLSTPDRGSRDEPFRRLALYHVAHNLLGLDEALWPIQSRLDRVSENWMLG